MGWTGDCSGVAMLSEIQSANAGLPQPIITVQAKIEVNGAEKNLQKKFR